MAKKRKKKYHDQVVKAVRESIDLITDSLLNFIVVAAGMQSGKTEFIACMHELMREIYPNTLSLYATAHDHLDFRKQNWDRLEHLEKIDLYCLTLSDRKKDQIKGKNINRFSNDPIILFFDENHFGDGLEQTIDTWIQRNGLAPSKRVIFIGISATPFSSMERALEGVCQNL
ncbi:MAG: hypothetical protein ISR65_19870 [Bacteriovoracaceae bacterium]|nr:hypothetical protein [Candidatus Brocadiales bacterium]MBL6992051.1 hypothetical protein [Bacteriovoracaceae bacterium]